MYKYDCRPSSLQFVPSLGVLVGLIVSSGLSTSMHETQDNLYTMLACTSLVLFMSHIFYLFLTTTQWIYSHITVCARKPPAKTLPSHVSSQETHSPRTYDDREILKTYTITHLVTKTVDFSGQKEPRRLYLTRVEMWHILYPFTLGIFMLFVCIPTYDATCSTCIAFGFLVYASILDYNRGIHWKRPASRTIVCLMTHIAGFVSCILVFACAYVFGFVLTQDAWKTKEHVVDVLKDVKKSNFQNISSPSIALVNMLTKPQNETNIARNLDYFYIATGDTSIIQYLSWSNDAYHTRMVLLWLLCITVPWLLETAPDSVNIPSLVEISQPSLSALCAICICLVSISTDSRVFSLVKAKNAMGGVFMLTGSSFGWMSVFGIVYCLRKKCISHISVLFLVVSFTKLMCIHDNMVYLQKFTPLLGCAGGALCVHGLLLIYLIRAENIAIRKGWGESSDDLDSDEEFMNYGLSESTIQDVISESNKVISKGTSVADMSIKKVINAETLATPQTVHEDSAQEQLPSEQEQLPPEQEILTRRT